MKHYIYNDVTYDKMPDPLNTPNGQISPMYNSDGTPNEAKFIEFGGVITEDGKMTEFETNCMLFRQLCYRIREFTGDSTFKGGFDEFTKFAMSEAYSSNPVMASLLSTQWAGLNEACKYTGAKEGYGQPKWWYRCWELEHQEDHDQPVEELPNPYEEEVVSSAE